MKNFKFPCRDIFPQIFVIFVILASIGACGKKSGNGTNAAGGAGDVLVAPIDYSGGGGGGGGGSGPINPGPNPNAQLVTAISGTYRGTLYTNHNQVNGTAYVRIVADGALNISGSVSAPNLNPGMAFVSTFLSGAGAFIYFNYPYSGSVGRLGDHQIWVNYASIDFTNPQAPKLNLTLNSLETSYGDLGGWNIFTWSTYHTESAGWARIENLVKISN